MPRLRLTDGSLIRIFRLAFISFNLLTQTNAKPQWNNPSEFYSNSYQNQQGFVPTSAFGVSNQYGGQNTNYGGFNRPFFTRPGSFVPYGSSYGGTVGGGSSQGSTGSTTNAQNTPESDENVASPHNPNPEHVNPPNPISTPNAGMGTQMANAANVITSGMPSPMPGAGLNMNVPVPMNPMFGNGGYMGTQIADTMNPNGGYGAMAGNPMNGAMNQWPSNQQYGMTNNCFGPGCNTGAFPGAAMNPAGGYDYPATAGYGANLGQATGGGEDYNSAEESAEIAAGEDIEQANLRRYAEYLNLVNRRYGIGMPGQGNGVSQNVQPNIANVITNPNAGAVGTGTFGMGGIDYGMMNGNVETMNTPNINPTAGVSGGISSTGTSTSPSGMGALVGRYSSQQPTMNGFTSGIVGYGSYMPPNIYETPNYPVQWPMTNALTGSSMSMNNMAGTGNNMGYGIDNFGPTGAIPAEYMQMTPMPLPSPAPYGYAAGMTYPMSGTVYPQNVMPQIYQGLSASTGPPINPPELISKSHEKSSQESSATSHEHSTPQSLPPATSIQALTQQIRRLPAVLYVDSKDTDGRHVENLLRDTYGLPLVSFYVDKIDKPKVVEKYLNQLTAHKGLPYLFICGTFIGSQEHIENYHKQKQIPQLVEYVCGEEKDKKNAHRPGSHKEATKKRKSSGRHKSRRQRKSSTNRQSSRK